MSQSFEVGPDRSVLRRALVIYCLILAIITGGIALALALSEDTKDYDYWLVLWVFVLGFAILPGTSIPWWWWSVGRTRYFVGDGRLKVYRGSRVLYDWDCADIYGLWVRGGASWTELLNPKLDMADGKFPHLVVWTDQKIQLPSVLRVGHSAAHQLELDLARACRENGSRSKLGGTT